MSREPISTEDSNNHIENAPANRKSVARYLHEIYGVSLPDALTLVDKYKSILDEGIKLGSYAYFVGDAIHDASLRKRKDR